MMKKYIKYVLYFFIKKYFKTKFNSFMRDSNKANTWVVDIDNTIADTWRNYFDKKNPIGYIDLPPLEGMCQLLRTNQKETNIIFLSARHYASFWVTKKWLKKQGFDVNQNVILVGHPMEKYELIAPLCATSKSKITFFDDLSYNHENGEVKFYNTVIEKVHQLPVTYIGYNDLLKINKF